MNTLPTTDRDSNEMLITPDFLEANYPASELSNLENRASQCPVEITDAATYGIWQDTIADIATEIKRIDAQRKDVKAPYLQACGTIEGFFKGLEKRATDASKQVTSVCTAYMRRIRDEEIRRRKEEARKLREEEERKRLEAETKAEEARKLEEANKPKRAETKQAQADDAARESQTLGQHALAVEQSANAKSADLSRTRSATGTLGSLKDEWDFSITDIEKIQGSPIWPYIKREHKEMAIRAYMKANAPKNLPPAEQWQPLRGVNFYRKDTLQVRR